MLRNEVMKLKAGEIYCEVGVSKKTLLFVHRMRKDIDIYGIDTCEDPCVAGTYYLQGESEDISDVWFYESEGSLISVLLINSNFDENYQIWKDYVKPRGAIFNGATQMQISP